MQAFHLTIGKEISW